MTRRRPAPTICAPRSLALGAALLLGGATGATLRVVHATSCSNVELVFEQRVLRRVAADPEAASDGWASEAMLLQDADSQRLRLVGDGAPVVTAGDLVLEASP